MRKGLVLLLFLWAGAVEAVSDCVLVRDGQPVTEIRMEASGPVVEFAAAEIRKYVLQMSGATIGFGNVETPGGRAVRRREPGRTPRLEANCALTLAVEPALGPDAFRIGVSRRGMSITGGNDRGVLYGVYEMLEMLGCRFLAPGPGGENVPKAQTLKLRMGERTLRPALRHRGLIVQQPLTEGNLKMADWMAKNQMNYWVNPYWVFLSAEPDLKRRFAEALEARGITWEFGHHTFTQWITQGGFLPDVRGLKAGVRTSAAICISKPEAAEKVARNMADFAAQWPQVDVLSLWPNDTFDGWCECEHCMALYGNLPEWTSGIPLMTRPYFWFVERVTEALARLGVYKPVSALAYNNTIEPVSGMPLPDRVQVTVAPILRDYSRPIFELPYFNSVLSDWTGLLGSMSPLGRDGARVMAYEYYAGMYGNNSLPMPTVTALADDIEGYRQTGFGGITTQAEAGHWGTYSLDYYALARMSYRGERNPEDFIEDFSRNYYGPAWAPMTQYWTFQESLIRSGGEVKPAAQFFRRLRNTPGAIETLEQLVLEAEALAGSDIVRDRVRLSRLSIDYVKLLRDAVEAGRGRILELLPPTPKGTGHLPSLGAGEFVQIRIPVSREGNIAVSLGNVVPMTGAGTSYQLEVRRDAAGGPLVHMGAAFTAANEAQAAEHITARDWAHQNRLPLDVTGHLGEADYERGWLDLFVTAHVAGDTWTIYRDRDDGGEWDMKVSVVSPNAAEERAVTWLWLEEFVAMHAQAGIFNGTPEFVLSFCRKIVDEGW